MFSRWEAFGGRFGRVFIAAVLAATCLRVWLGPGEVLPSAAAQIPDSGLQRKEMLDELRRTNQLLEQVLRTLQTETLKVTVEGTDKTPEGVPLPRPKKP